MLQTVIAAAAALDLAVAQWVAQNAPALLVSIGHLVSWLISPVPILFVVAWYYWNHQEKKAFYATSLVALAGVASSALKIAFARPRPEFLGYPSTVAHAPTDYAFPSGHATLAGSIFGYARRHKKWYLSFALIMAASRVLVGAHFLSDVAAGLLLGYFVGKANRVLQKRTAHMHFRITLLREEAILFGSVVATLALVFWLQQLYLAALLIGFYAGYTVWKELGMRQTHRGPVRLALGYVGLGLIGFASLPLPPAQSIPLLAAAGAWITLFWPLFVEKVFKPAKPSSTHTRATKTRRKRRGNASARKRKAGKSALHTRRARQKAKAPSTTRFASRTARRATPASAQDTR